MVDARHFDALTRLLSGAGSRRRVLALLVALPVLGALTSELPRPLASDARGKKKRNHRGKGHDRSKNKNKKRTTAQAEGCWRAGACIPGKGANVSRCDLSSTTSFPGLNCTGCNLSRANLRGVNAQGAIFTRANLSGACLVDANFSGAIFTNNTNLANAIFCNTTMPDGSVNDSGCGSVTACCAGSCATSTAWANLTTFGSNGSGTSEFARPQGIAIASDTLTAWVADTNNNRISIWTRPNPSSTTWSNQAIFGSGGSGASEFSNPQGIAVAGDTLTVLVADSFNGRVSVWTRPNTSSTTWTNQTTFGSSGSSPNQFASPRSVSVASDALTAWVADTGNHRISIWTRPNASSTAWTNQTTFGSNGSGASELSNPLDVALSSDTLTAWVADSNNNRISVWTRPNSSSTAWTNQTTFGSFGTGPDQFRVPFGVAVASDTLTAWVVDLNNNRISVWTRPNTSSTAWSNQTTFGSEGSGASEFSSPRSVSVASDTLTVWVADNLNNRISIWELTCPT